MNFKLTALFSLTLASSVFLSGLHASEISALTAIRLQAADAHKAVKDDQGAVDSSHAKVGGDVHNHIEKQTLKSALKTFGDHNLQADERHLKRQRHHARRAPRSKRFGLLSVMSRMALLAGA